MTATDELRRLLDERGVEWWEATPCKTKWSSPILGGPVAAREWNGEMVLDTGYIAVTPEQAIAATLGDADATPTRQGVGTCHDRGNIERFICSECGCRLDLQDDDWEPTMWLDDGTAMVPHFCPNCGRRVVE